MLLKDRIHNDNAYFQCGGGGGFGKQNKKSGEICKRLNRGNCTFGLSCRYEHHCSVPKCGKFGHGAHICRLRLATEAQANSGSSQDRLEPVGAGTNSHNK